MTPEEYKQLSIKEFTRAARIYDSDHAGIYEMCKHDYPPVLAELEKESFHDVLDCGCGTGPMIQLLHEKYPDRRYVGLDLTPEMIHVAQAKQLSNTQNFLWATVKICLLQRLLLMLSSAPTAFTITRIHKTSSTVLTVCSEKAAV